MKKYSLRIGVVCDDLTGGGDIGSQFIVRGLKTRISRSVDDMVPPPPDTEVWIINTGSRALPPRQAGQRVRKALKALKEFSPDYIYKKIDSTLRGNIGSELDASLSEMELDSIPLCAAFPRMGRKTVDGIHYVDGKILAESHYARDAESPVKESDIRVLLSSQMEHPEKIEVLDASTAEDMEKNCAGRGGAFFSGAAAWAGKLADAWMASERKPEPLVFSPAPVLIVSGSLNPVTLRQVEYFKNSAEKSGKEDMIISSSDSGEGSSLKKMLARATKTFFKSYTRAVISGGATASEFLKELGVNEMEVVAAPMEGVSLVAHNENFFILKPGGFGDEEALVKLCAALGGR